jgi:predicted TPR repeat methyltransferase
MMTAPDPGREPVITYWQAQDAYRTTIEACERFDELAGRDLTARALAMLKARGTYDPAKHADASKYQPLTADEHLELLATGEMLARRYRHPAHVHDAVQAGVTWPQIAEATGSDEARVRQEYREWADSQHRLHSYYGGTIGLNDADHAAAILRASEPPAGRGNEREAGQ